MPLILERVSQQLASLLAAVETLQERVVSQGEAQQAQQAELHTLSLAARQAQYDAGLQHGASPLSTDPTQLSASCASSLVDPESRQAIWSPFEVARRQVPGHNGKCEAERRPVPAASYGHRQADDAFISQLDDAGLGGDEGQPQPRSVDALAGRRLDRSEAGQDLQHLLFHNAILLSELQVLTSTGSTDASANSQQVAQCVRTLLSNNLRMLHGNDAEPDATVGIELGAHPWCSRCLLVFLWSAGTSSRAVSTAHLGVHASCA